MKRCQWKAADFLNFRFLSLLFELVLMAAMAYVFTFYLDGDIGVVIIAFLILAPVLSVQALLLTRKIRVAVQAPTYVPKGKHFAVRLQLASEGKLPVPFVRCGVEGTANLTADDPRPVQSAMLASQPIEVEFGMTAAYAGRGRIRVPELCISDYLGMLTCYSEGTPEDIAIGVIPDIPSLTGAAVLLHTVSDAVLTQDEEEEESSAAYSSVSMPGYIHRNYVPGDNLRRINWKLSAKRHQLMVRMDEAASTVRPSILLDLQSEDTPEALKKRELLMEGALGLLMLLVRQGVPCSLRFADGGTMKHLFPESEDAVRQAALELAAADFVSGSQRIDTAAVQEKAGAFVIYTARPDAALVEAIRSLQDKGDLYMVVPEGTVGVLVQEAQGIWTLSEDFTMTAVQK